MSRLNNIERELIKRLELEFRRTGIKKVGDVMRRRLWLIARDLPNFPLMIGYLEGSVTGDKVNHLDIYQDVKDDELAAIPIADYARMDVVEHYKMLRKSYHEGTDKGKEKAIQAYIDFIDEKFKEFLLKNPQEIHTIADT